MTIEIIGDRSGNSIEIEPGYLSATNGTIRLNGTGNVVAIRTGKPSQAVSIVLSGSSKFEMREGSSAGQLNVLLRGGSTASIGQNTFAIGKVTLYSHETADISIGSRCLLGGNLQCLTSDMHSILDMATKQRINPGASIKIHDDVWVATDVTFLKGTEVGRESIVGIRSTVMGHFPPNCIILGYPARVVKTGVTWDKALLPMPE